MRVVVHPDPEFLARAAAGFIAGLLKQAAGPRVSLGLAGGSTPKATYEQLRWQPVDWQTVDLWLSDERWVPPDDSESNGGMAAAALTDHIEARVLRPRWSRFLTARDSAAFYEAELRRVIPEGRSDVILLGMGSDGHTASLFPGTAALDETTRWFVANEVPQVDAWRLTATAPMIQRAGTVVVLTAGESKASMVAEAFEGEDGSIPIQLLRRAEGDVVWLVDEAAAAELTKTPAERASG
jgi:6-phosphogluconolactonase